MINVLWIDDIDDIQGYIDLASEEGIEVDHFHSWEEAEESVFKEDEWRKYTTILLDFYCKIKKNDAPTDKFAGVVVPKIKSILDRNHTNLNIVFISAGNAAGKAIGKGEDFEKTYEYSASGQYEMISKFDTDFKNKLFHKIKEDAAQDETYKIKALYPEVFNILDDTLPVLLPEIEGFWKKTSNNLVSFYGAIHYPENHPELILHLDIFGNTIRSTLEAIFHGFIRMGIYVPECLKPDGKLIMKHCLYLFGSIDQNHAFRVNNTNNHSVQKIWLDRSIQIDKTIVSFFHNIIDKGNPSSHPDNEKLDKYMLFTLVNELSCIVMYFDKYYKLHPDMNDNQSKIHRI